MLWVIIGIVCQTLSVLLFSFVFMLGSLSHSWTPKDRKTLYWASLVIYLGAGYVIISNVAPGA